MKSRMAGLLSVARHIRENFNPMPPVAMWQSATNGSGGMGWVEVEEGHDLGVAAARMRDQIGPTVWFAVVFDTYAKDGDPVGDLEYLDMGALERAFENGDPSVVEQIVLVVWHGGEKDPEMAWQVYRWTPVDGWEWDRARMVADPSEVASTVRWV